MKHTVFVGYDVPLALEIKHDMVIPLLDKVFKRIDLDGDIMHIIGPISKGNLPCMLRILDMIKKRFMNLKREIFISNRKRCFYETIFV